MSLRPPSQKLFAASGEPLVLRQFELENSDLKIAQELERQIIEGHIWAKVVPVVLEVVDPFVGKELNELTVYRAQQALDARFHELGPDFPLPGVKLVLKVNPEDPLSLLLELQ